MIFSLFLPLSFFVSALASSPSFAALEQEEKVAEEKSYDIAKVSESFGHLLGKNIETLGIDFDLDRVILGLQNARAGKKPPLSEMECVQAISLAQENAFKKTALDNLKKAETFLDGNGKKEGIVSLEEGKLQYKVEKEGSGASVEGHDAPLIRYSGKYLDGTVFGSSKEDERISLDETIPGFTKGLVGMKEGEKRVLYIHPDLGYGTSGYLPPNSLLTFEIELVKANAPQVVEGDALSTGASHKGKANQEIATPAYHTEALR